MEIDPITLRLVCFPAIGSREGERKIDRGEQRCGERDGKGKRNGRVIVREKRNRMGESWSREREMSKIEKDVEKRQEDTVYVIRGDGMAVGVVSSLEGWACSPCISVVLIGDHHWARWKKRAKKAKDKEEGSERMACSEGMIYLRLRGLHQNACGVCSSWETQLVL